MFRQRTEQLRKLGVRTNRINCSLPPNRASRYRRQHDADEATTGTPAADAPAAAVAATAAAAAARQTTPPSAASRPAPVVLATVSARAAAPSSLVFAPSSLDLDPALFDRARVFGRWFSNRTTCSHVLCERNCI